MTLLSTSSRSDGSATGRVNSTAMRHPSRGAVIRTGVWAAVIILAVGALIFTLREAPGSIRAPFQTWYGNWRSVALASLLFLAFLPGRRRRPSEV